MKWFMGIVLLLAAVLAVYLLSFRLPEPQRTAVQENAAFPSTPADAAAAATIYKSSCLPCHGGNLQGGMGPSLKTIGSSWSKEQLFRQISQGGGGMPGFKSKLEENDIVNLTLWLSEQK
ncbi:MULTISPECIES: cytochrome c [Paenibacillus]|uniref:c-type cytochrome n=1 Tax=Paenibacillus TaxID=44249 RepID=UPI0004217A2C|nr:MULTISPECIES: cytochrome c [Paenibacillus]CDN44552.1 Uncharacterized protein BN871_FB_00030 [Paenibacillus sp. P22]